MIMGKMLKNMAYFVILLLVVLMAFGVCRQSILFPNEEPNWRLIRHVFYQPYFMLYGEVFAGDIDPDCGGVDEIECHPGRWITPTVMSLYLLVANILLINLLIAVFNNIFMSVHSISHQIWMFQRFQVVMEFEEKPVFPPPLIILSHIFRVFKYLLRNWKGKPFIYGHGLKVFLGGENLERIHDFEEECVDAYISEKEQKECSSTEERVRTITDRTDALSQRLDDMHNQVVLSLASLKSLDFFTKRLHEEIKQVNSNYNGIQQLLLHHFRRYEGSTKFDPQSSEQQIVKIKSNRVDVYIDKENEDLPCDFDDKKGMQRNLFIKPSVCGKKINEDSEVPKRRKKSFRDVRHRRTKYVFMREKAHPDRQATRCQKCNIKSSYKIPLDVKKINRPKVAFKDLDADEFCDVNGKVLLKSNSDQREQNFASDLKNSKTQLHSTSTLLTAALTAEYTSLGDELETACMAKLTPPLLPNLSASTHYARSRHQSDSAAPQNVYNNKPLRDAEESDYHLMEGIIQRRLHRDSENLAVSLEELCSVFTSSSDEENNVNFCKDSECEFGNIDCKKTSDLYEDESVRSRRSKEIVEPLCMSSSDIITEKDKSKLDNKRLPLGFDLQTRLLDLGSLCDAVSCSTSADISLPHPSSMVLQDTQPQIELSSSKIEEKYKRKSIHHILNVEETEVFNTSNPHMDSTETKF